MNEAHRKAPYVLKLIENPVLLMTDLDGTAASGDYDPSAQELSDRASLRKFTRQKGMVEGAVTARAPSLLQDSATFQATRARGCQDEEPRWGVDPATGKRIFVKLEEQPYFASSLNWDAHLCYGTRIDVKNGSGYVPDTEYDDLLRYDHLLPSVRRFESLSEELRAVVEQPVPWRHEALLLLGDILPEINGFLAPIEFRTKFENGETDTEPRPNRIQIMRRGREGLQMLARLKRRIVEEMHKGNRLALRCRLSDESKIAESAENSVFQAYLVPRYGRKEWMVNWFLNQASIASGIEHHAMRLMTADDQWTGLRMLLYVSGKMPTTSLLPTGSPVARSILQGRTHHGHLPLTQVLGRSFGPGLGYERLRPAIIDGTVRKGVYFFRVATRMKYPNVVVIGDEVYPELTAPGSVHAFLEEFY